MVIYRVSDPQGYWRVPRCMGMGRGLELMQQMDAQPLLVRLTLNNWESTSKGSVHSILNVPIRHKQTIIYNTC